MDQKLSQYQQIIKDILQRYENLLNSQAKANQEIVKVCDDIGGHFMLHRLGWKGERRVWQTIVYVRLLNGEFWIEEDGLEQGIATDLLEANVPNNDIVLAFHHPDVRPLTEFTVA